MITVVKCYGFGRIDAFGLSTDEKPQEVAGIPVGNASFFYEIDTKNVSMYDEENHVWVKQ